jgi:hypothetical protein
VLTNSHPTRLALWPTQPPIQWVPGAISLGVKRPGREADHSPPSSAEVKEWVELYLNSPNTPSWRGAQLKHRDNFTFTLTNSIGQNILEKLTVTQLVKKFPAFYGTRRIITVFTTTQPRSCVTFSNKLRLTASC